MEVARTEVVKMELTETILFMEHTGIHVTLVIISVIANKKSKIDVNLLGLVFPIFV